MTIDLDSRLDERERVPTPSKVMGVILAVVIGVAGALILFHGWSGGFR